MYAKRIIPCLDVSRGRVVKGTSFVHLRDAGDPVQAAVEYDRQGADELVFLDIGATAESRGIMADMVHRVADRIFIPFTAGGGIRTVGDFSSLLRAGADKVSVNSAALLRHISSPKQQKSSGASALFAQSTLSAAQAAGRSTAAAGA